jgi:hypothetical protein
MVRNVKGFGEPPDHSVNIRSGSILRNHEKMCIAAFRANHDIEGYD